MLSLTLATSLAACSGRVGGSGDKPPPDPVDPKSDPSVFTMSYRSLVRVPEHGTAMRAQAFVEQVNRLDPIAAKRCPVSNSGAFKTAADALGGITWTHPIAMLKDQSLPPLYRGRIPAPSPPTPSAPGATDGRSAAAPPTIVRPDLVGYQEDTAIFLSQRHGLLAVKTAGPAPELSCALKLPGQPKYFFYQGDELVLLVNGSSVNQAALLRFRVTRKGFDFVDAVMLDQQNIQDARLFDRTLVVYSNLLRPIASDGQPMTPPPGGGGTPGGGARGAPVPGPAYNPNTGVVLTAIKWDAALAVAWREEFLNDQATAEPFAGQDPVMAASKLVVGDVVSATKNWKPFISASDRYVVVSRDVNRTVFSGTRTETYSYCAASHQGPAHSVQTCSPKYEQRPNPDYRPPQSTKGDYTCNGKTLLACIQEAAPTVSQYIYVRVGETCTTYTYHDYICDRQETRMVSYPTYRNEQATQFVVYRYDAGDFVKLDERIYEMADPGAATVVSSLTFNGKPLEVDGAIDHKGDLQFQHGHFYVLTHQGQRLHTLLLVGNSIAKLGAQATPRQPTGGSSYSGSHSTLFSDDRMMISRAYYDPRNPMNIPNWSDVLMLDLTVPAFPKAVNQFVMPGSSDQLILAADGVLGPGTVAFTSGGVPRNLQKLTLFNRSDASELGNVLLGTEFNANMVSTWLGVSDDQRIRLDPDNQRLFLPYSGYHHAPKDKFNPTAHRLNITAVANRLLTSEVTFDVVEDIVRTVSTASAPSAGRVLAFGDSSVYALAQTPGSWSLDVIEEFATPMAVYRFSDKGDLHARIDRIGNRCQISTFAGSLNAFKSDHVGLGPKIQCPEGTLPRAVALSVVFAETGTGWDLSADGREITALDAAAVKERLTHVSSGGYCAVDAKIEDGTPVAYLDEVPPSITCFPPNAGGPGRP
ncbi:MAG TPA: hypothetical protein VN914_19955 [Polyangia bacterium]|nr:hypothetical protein [Polyangia bacterium]